MSPPLLRRCPRESRSPALGMSQLTHPRPSLAGVPSPPFLCRMAAASLRGGGLVTRAYPIPPRSPRRKDILAGRPTRRGPRLTARYRGCFMEAITARSETYEFRGHHTWFLIRPSGRKSRLRWCALHRSWPQPGCFTNGREDSGLI